MTESTTPHASMPRAETPPPARENLLVVEGLVKHFPIKAGVLRRQVGAVQAVDGVDFEVRTGETFSIQWPPWAERSEDIRRRAHVCSST